MSLFNCFQLVILISLKAEQINYHETHRVDQPQQLSIFIDREQIKIIEMYPLTCFQWPCINEKKQKKKRGYKNSGVVFVMKCEVGFLIFINIIEIVVKLLVFN